MTKNMPWWACQYPFKPQEKQPVVLKSVDSIPRVYGRGSKKIPTVLYVSTDLITCAGFSLRPGSVPTPPDIHAGDEVYYVLRGTITIFNPDNGQAFTAEKGDVFWIPWKTWHTPCNLGNESLEVLTFFSPKIWSEDERGTDIRYEKTPKTLDLTQPLPKDFPSGLAPMPTCCLGSHPMAGPEGRSKQQMVTVKPTFAIPLVVGKEHLILYRTFISNDVIHVATVDIPAGHQSDIELHGGDEIACVLSGVLSVLIGDASEVSVSTERLEAKAGEKILVPKGTPHRYYNFGDEPVSMLKAVAPSISCEDK